MQIRAIHLELTYSLALDEFNNAFLRFISRRGIPFQIRSDNAKTFQAASRKLTTLLRINWKFNVEKSPWAGGAWERLVRSVKTALRYSISSIHFQTQQLQTLICKIEYIINSRPITYCTGNEEESISLTPNDFLIPVGNSEINHEIPNDHSAYEKAFKYNKLIVRRFWSRWKTEYLLQLNKNQPRIENNVTVGSIMLLER